MIGPKVARRMLFTVLVPLVVLGVAACTSTAPSSPAQPTAQKPAAQQPAAPAAQPTAAPAAQQPAAPAAQAPQEVKIGAVYPLSGPDGSTGQENVAAAKLAAAIVNDPANLELRAQLLPSFGQTPGLPGLGGAKLTIVSADSQGDPQTGRAEAERLISQQKPAVVIGCDASSVTKTASEAAERAGIPFVNPDSTSPALTGRGLKWFFRTTPHDDMFVEDSFIMLKDLNTTKNAGIKSVTSLTEDSEAGTQIRRLVGRFAPQYGFPIAADIVFHTGTTDLTSEVLKLKTANADVVIADGYQNDVILLIKTLKEMNYMPKMLLGQRAGYTEYQVLKALGADFNYVSSTNVVAPDLTKTNPRLKAVGDMFQKATGDQLSDNPSRVITGMLVVADAINRAKSTDPEAIRQALIATNFGPNQLIVPWDGIKFDQNQQNTLGRGVTTQVLNGDFVTVWPAGNAAGNLVYPAPGWGQR